jgi:hypothetical protein
MCAFSLGQVSGGIVVYQTLSRSIAVLAALFAASGASAQTHQHDQSTPATSWHVMQDFVAFGVFNHQGGRRGGDEFRVPHWWMGMFNRKVGASDLTLNAMLSLDPLTVSKRGYRELFQVGEAFEGRPLVDYQHPHDLFMQLAAVWRIPIGTNTGLTFAGGPSGEPAIGPVAFMHRASAIENPISPLSHHTLDSTHVAFGVVTAAVDRGPWTIEASLFNGREPDEDRWDFDFGAMNSYSGRLWFRPSERWELQLSSARLTNPEELGHGDIVRSTGSVSWLQLDGEDFFAVTAAYGMNNGEDANRSAFLFEATRRIGSLSPYGRVEVVETETGVVLDDHSLGHNVTDTVAAVTLGVVRDLPRWRGLGVGIGAAATFYGVPRRLEVSYGNSPVSFQVFLRVRPVAGSMGRMWNMHMTKPMHAPAATDPHSIHAVSAGQAEDAREIRMKNHARR